MIRTLSKYYAATLIFFVGAIAAQVQEAPKNEVKGVQEFQRGAKRTPLPLIIDAIKSGKATVYKAAVPPPKVITVPKRLSVWGNNQYGDCVTAESAFAIACYSVFVGMEEIYIPEATVISWARAHGWLNGADLLSVIHDMQVDGIKDENGIVRKAGTPSSVDYRIEVVLQSAVAQGPVDIAIDAGALPSGAGTKQGWSAFGGRSYPNTDHCVSVFGYGPTADLFKALNVAMPAGAPDSGYYLFTWGTIGVVDHKWILNTCVEAWVRNPTVKDLDPPKPPEPPAKVVVTVSNVSGAVGVPVKISPTAAGGTSPYIFLFDYGDGTQDAAGSHTYKEAGSYKVTVSAVDSAGQLGTATCVATIGSTPPIPPLPPIPGGGLIIQIPQDTPAGTYQLVLPGDLDEIQRRLDAIRGLKAIPKR